LAWPLLIAASVKVRQLLVQFVGDVAIYVTPYKLDSYFELRDEIKKKVSTALRAVYGLKDEANNPVYSAVFVVGHSLGSVIVYDALNALINEDRVPGSKLRVVDRTKMFLTFGSPLDKTAFFFSVQGGGDRTRVREALAGTVQPLIQRYECRPDKWINIWSRWDIISGKLDLYDPLPGGEKTPHATKAVCNQVDPDANILLGAHTQYWSNPYVYRTLYDAIGTLTPN
jgi:hypothetical protein